MGPERGIRVPPLVPRQHVQRPAKARPLEDGCVAHSPVGVAISLPGVAWDQSVPRNIVICTRPSSSGTRNAIHSYFQGWTPG